jgi:hypothetical protein
MHGVPRKPNRHHYGVVLALHERGKQMGYGLVVTLYRGCSKKCHLLRGNWAIE